MNIIHIVRRSIFCNLSFFYKSVMRMVVISSMSDTGLVLIWMAFAAAPLRSKLLDSSTVVVGTDSMTVVGTRFLPSWWCWWWLLLFCTKLPLRFERVDAADALLLLREPRREPEYVELDFKSIRIFFGEISNSMQTISIGLSSITQSTQKRKRKIDKYWLWANYWTLDLF